MTLSYTTRQEGARLLASADHRGYLIEVATAWDTNTDRCKVHLYLTNPEGARSMLRSWDGDYHTEAIAIEAGMQAGEAHVDALASQQP